MDVKSLTSKLREYVRLAGGRRAAVQGWVRGPLVVAEEPPPSQPVATWDELRPELDRDREER